MGQYWLICAPQRKESSGHLGKLGEIMFSDIPDRLAMMLARPEVDIKLIESIWQERDCSREANRSKQQGESKPILSLLCLFCLLREIFALVIEVSDYRSLLRLAVTSSFFWENCRGRLIMIQSSLMALWADQKIACVGDYVSVSDHPPGMFTEQEKRDLARISLSDEDDDEDDDDEDDPRNHSLYDIALETYRIIKAKGSRKLRIPSIPLSSVSYKLWPAPESVPPNMEESLARIREIFYSEHRAWILRNITTQECVRAEGIARHPEHIHGPKIDHVGFGHVVLMLICWSSDPSTSGVYKKGVARGRWAGHRFEITTVDRHEASIGADEHWKDVSAEINEEIKDIWGSAIGTY